MIDRAALKEMLASGAQVLLDNADRLSEIDSLYGDGDHGITASKIAKAILEQVRTWDDEISTKEFFNELGAAIMAVRGGSAGLLYGTLVGGLGVQLDSAENEITADGARRMFAGSLAEMSDITSAQVGDKTMMDAFIPAVEAAQKVETAPDNAAAIFLAAANAAEKGAESSAQFSAKFGRARSYRDKTIGTPDAGAVSTALFLRGLADGCTT